MEIRGLWIETFQSVNQLFDGLVILKGGSDDVIARCPFIIVFVRIIFEKYIVILRVVAIGSIKNRHAVYFTITLLEGDRFVGISLILERRVE